MQILGFSKSFLHNFQEKALKAQEEQLKQRAETEEKRHTQPTEEKRYT